MVNSDKHQPVKFSFILLKSYISLRKNCVGLLFVIKTYVNADTRYESGLHRLKFMNTEMHII